MQGPTFNVTLNIWLIVSSSQVGKSRRGARGVAFFSGTGAGTGTSTARFFGIGVGAGCVFGLGDGLGAVGGVLGPADAAGDGLGELEMAPWSLASRFKRIYRTPLQ